VTESEYCGGIVGVEGVVREDTVTRSVTIYMRHRAGEQSRHEACRGKTERTRLSKVFRLPTKTISPSMKYAYSVCSVVSRMYLVCDRA